jgi:ribosome biogenesis GTPase
VRRVLKSFQLDQRNVVAVGDNVCFTPLEDEGVVEQVQDRKGRLFRRYRKQEHLIVTNIEQAVIVAAVATPELRVHLLDRYIVAALAGELKPVIVFNKIDLPSDEDIDGVQRVYESLGYAVCRTSVATGEGIEQLRALMAGRRSVVAGLSGVGKSSLINAVQPGANLIAKPVNRASGRGQHTTTTVQLLRLEGGGYVVDTPGIRQFAFWNIDRMNLEAYFAEFGPYIAACRFANCSHTHEIECAVKAAVECGEIADWRYDSYLKIFNDEEEFMKEWEK